MVQVHKNKRKTGSIITKFFLSSLRTAADRVMMMTTPDVAALARVTDFSNVHPPPSSNTTRVMTSHLELIQELQQLDKVPSLERLRAAQKRRTQQLKRWAVYEKEMQSKKRKADKKARNASSLQYEHKKHVSFAASVALLEASARNDPEEGKTIKTLVMCLTVQFCTCQTGGSSLNSSHNSHEVSQV